MFPRTSFVAIALAAVAALPGVATAAGLKPGIYDCMGSSSPRVINSVAVTSGGHYAVAPYRTGKQLKGAQVRGRFRAQGQRITWLSGTFKRAGYVSTIYPRGYFSLDRARDGVWTGISCFRQP